MCFFHRSSFGHPRHLATRPRTSIQSQHWPKIVCQICIRPVSRHRLRTVIQAQDVGKADWKGSRFLSQNACLGLRWECSFAPQVFNSSQRWIDEISFQPPFSGPNSKRQGKANAVAFSSTVYTSFYGPCSSGLFSFTSRKNEVRWVLYFSNPFTFFLNEIAECKDSCTVKYIYGLHGLFHLFRINVFLKSSINPFAKVCP